MRKSGKIIIGVVVIMVLGAAIFRLVFPPLSSRLANSSWCVNAIYYKGRLIQPHTLHAIYMIQKDGRIPCYEDITFDSDGNVQLPGLNSRAIGGEWMVDSTKKLQLNVDSIKDIYQGAYDITIRGNKLVLKSNTTIIDASR